MPNLQTLLLDNCTTLSLHKSNVSTLSDALPQLTALDVRGCNLIGFELEPVLSTASSSSSSGNNSSSSSSNAYRAYILPQKPPATFPLLTSLRFGPIQGPEQALGFVCHFPHLSYLVIVPGPYWKDKDYPSYELVQQVIAACRGNLQDFYAWCGEDDRHFVLDIDHPYPVVLRIRK